MRSDTSTGHPPRDDADALRRGTTLRRIAPALGLFFLAPLVAEYLLGNISIRHLWAMPILAPMYGGGAVLIRELARRAGRGWPTMLLLGLAYGLLEAGLLDQSLFNPSFQGHDFQSVTPIPALGISAYNSLAFIVGHAIWSIGVPIALVESFVPQRRTTPWLGNLGLVVTAVVFTLGCYIIFDDLRTTEQYLATPPQRIGAASVVAALIACAFMLPKPGGWTVERRAPNPWLVGIVSFVAASLFFAAPESWPGVAWKLVLIAAIAFVFARWSRRMDWGAAHRLAAAGGALLTYAWGGFVLTTLFNPGDTVAYIGNLIFALGAIGLLVAAARVVRASPPASGDRVRRRRRARVYDIPSPPARYTLVHNGRRLEVEVSSAGLTNSARLLVDGRQVDARQASIADRTTLQWGDRMVVLAWGWLPGSVASCVLREEQTTGDAVPQIDDTPLDPPAGSYAASIVKLQHEQPALYASRHVALATVKVLIPLLGIGALLTALLPQFDILWIEDIGAFVRSWVRELGAFVRSLLPSLDIPFFGRPEWLPRIAGTTLGGWIKWVVGWAKWVVPIAIALGVAVEEWQRLKRKRNGQTAHLQRSRE